MRFGETVGILVAIAFLGVAVFLMNAPAPEDVPLVEYKGELIETDGPVSYYMNKCARCHGPADNAYAEFEKPHRGEDLKQWIVAMAEGPAIAPLDAHGLDLQFHLHNAMLDKAPYIWTDDTKTNVLAGETIDGCTVILQTDTQRLRATITDQKFTLPREAGLLIVERDGKRVEKAIPK